MLNNLLALFQIFIETNKIQFIIFVEGIVFPKSESMQKNLGFRIFCENIAPSMVKVPMRNDEKVDLGNIHIQLSCIFKKRRLRLSNKTLCSPVSTEFKTMFDAKVI